MILLGQNGMAVTLPEGGESRQFGFHGIHQQAGEGLEMGQDTPRIFGCQIKLPPPQSSRVWLNKGHTKKYEGLNKDLP